MVPFAMADAAVAYLEGMPQEQASASPSRDALRCLEILTADQHRLGGALPPERADSLFEKRSLSPADRSWVYSQLGIGTPDNTEDSPEKNGDDKEEPEEEQESPSALADPVEFLLNATRHSRLLNHDEEKILGRLVLNANGLKSALAAGDIARDAQIVAAIRRGESAHSKLVLANLRLVVRIAYDFKWRTSIELSDLVQDGIIGLMRAVDGFDPELGHRFSTYASYWIRQSIGRAIQNTSRMIRIPVHMLDTINKLRKASRKLEAETLKPPTINKLADELGWDVATTEEVLALSVMTMVSADDEGDDEAPKSPLLLIDQLPSPQEMLESKELGAILEDMLGELPERQSEVIRRRFGFESEGGQEETLEQIGADHGVTRERIRQIEAKALDRLRHPGRAKRLTAYRSNSE